MNERDQALFDQLDANIAELRATTERFAKLFGINMKHIRKDQS